MYTEVMEKEQMPSLLDIKQGILVHQVNLQGVMGAGLALSLRTKYPQIYPSYRKYCQEGKFQLGMIQPIQINKELFICNLAGQDRYGRDRRYTDYEAVRTALRKLSTWQKQNHPKLDIFIPEGMGCRLAGGDWSIIQQIIQEECPQAILVRYEK